YKQNEQIEGLVTEKTERSDRQDLADVDGEIAAFKEQYSEKYGINLEEPDAEGVSLTARILQHGIKTGNNQSFTEAAKAYLFDRTLEIANVNGRTAAAQAVQADHKAGIVGRSATPTGETNFDPTRMTEDKVDEMAAAELHRMLGTT
ncbi:unnamed protein product, partial [marine sediment metagenome]